MRHEAIRQAFSQNQSELYALRLHRLFSARDNLPVSTGRNLLSAMQRLVLLTRTGRSFKGLTVLTALAAIGAPVAAQDFSAVVPAEYASEYEVLFSNPGDLERLYELARRAELDASRSGSESGYRFAIRLYERMLLIDPDFTQAALRLGEIHFRLGEFVAAGSYFRRAIEDPALPPDVRAVALRYTDQIEDELAQSRFSGRASFGLKYQSNPSLEDEPLVFPEPQGSDFNIYVGVGFTHVYDPGWQSGHTLETRFDASTQQYFKLKEIDSTSLDVSFGPRFRLDSYGIGNTSIRPYLSFAADTVDNDWYTIDTGGGIQATSAPTPLTRMSIDLNKVDKRHNPDQGVFSNADTLDGNEYNARVSADFRIAPRLDLGVGLYWRKREYPEANNEFVSDTKSIRNGADLLVRYRHAPLIDFGAGDWYLTLFVSHEQTELTDKFEGRTFSLRNDRQNKVLLTSEIPVTPAASVVAAVGHTGNNSDFAGYEYSNWEAYIGFTQKF